METKTAKGKVITLVIIVVCFTLSCWGYVWLRGIPFKVTDPSDPRFDPKRFCFCDYTTGTYLGEALATLFPVGTPQMEVQKVLVRAGKAEEWQDKNHASLVSYREPWRLHIYLPPHHVFTYDDQRRVLNIQPYGGPALFADQPTYKDLERQP